jgi:hypothetical protein
VQPATVRQSFCLSVQTAAISGSAPSAATSTGDSLLTERILPARPATETLLQ